MTNNHAQKCPTPIPSQGAVGRPCLLCQIMPTPIPSQEVVGRPCAYYARPASVPRLGGFHPAGGEPHVFARAIAPGPTGEGRGTAHDLHRLSCDLLRRGSNPRAHTPAGWRGRSPRKPMPRETRSPLGTNNKVFLNTLLVPVPAPYSSGRALRTSTIKSLRLAPDDATYVMKPN